MPKKILFVTVLLLFVSVQALAGKLRFALFVDGSFDRQRCFAQ
jgi:hypothetical protein